jgi:hypothetical protein
MRATTKEAAMNRFLVRHSIALLLLVSCSSQAPERIVISKYKGGVNGGDGSGDGSSVSDPLSLTKQGALHRLNKREYNATVRDLLDTKLQPANSFPDDPVGSNFDNEGDSLSISPTLMKYYYTAATTLASEASLKDFTVVTKCKTATDSPCLKAYIASFGLKAWRRPLTTIEVDSIFTNSARSMAAAAAPGPEFIRQTVSQFLVSPYFTFRIELDDAPGSKATRKLNAYELASRLSYFLWSSMPDEALLKAAADGTLLQDDVLKTKVASMINDPKASALVAGFADIWLGTDKAKHVKLDAALFPKFTDTIRDAMTRETAAFFQEYLKKDLDVNTMLTANFTYVNDELANYYGLPAPGSKEFVRVELPAGPRRGVLSQGSILSATSTETRTSIVKRGMFILSNILCITPPDLPPGTTIDPLPEAPAPDKTTREILAEHIAKPACAGCHAVIDPPGFAMEGFGPDGLARTLDRGNPVDSSGAYAGKPFSSASEFTNIIRSGGKFHECVAKKVFSYAMGRTLVSKDEELIATILKSNKAAGGKLRSIIELVVLSNAFRSR